VPGRLNALIGKSGEERRKGERRARRDPRGCGGRPARQGEEEKEGGRERLTIEARVSVSAKKRKRERERRADAGRASWAGRPGWAERGARQGFLFFQTSFSNHFSFEFQIKTLSNLFSKIYKLFRNHTSNQKPCKPTDDAQSLVVSKFTKLCLIF
jgi:hypothetical protein